MTKLFCDNCELKVKVVYHGSSPCCILCGYNLEFPMSFYENKNKNISDCWRLDFKILQGMEIFKK